MRTVAIIGDSKGIGMALRQRLLQRGDKVIGVSRTGAQADGNYTGLVFDAVAHPCDLSSFTDRLDGLVYCPGTIQLKPVRGVKPELVMEDFKVNAMGLLQTVQANLKLLKLNMVADNVVFCPELVSLRQNSWVSWTTAIVYSRPIARSSIPNLFSGLPSTVLYSRSHSRITSIVPGSTRSTSSMSLSIGASTSSAAITTHFQSVSPARGGGEARA